MVNKEPIKQLKLLVVRGENHDQVDNEKCNR